MLAGICSSIAEKYLIIIPAMISAKPLNGPQSVCSKATAWPSTCSEWYAFYVMKDATPASILHEKALRHDSSEFLRATVSMKRHPGS